MQYDSNLHKLYHAAARVEGILIPGYAGPGLYADPFCRPSQIILTIRRSPGCYVSLGGKEHVIQDNYEVLYVAFLSLRIRPLMNCVGVGALTPLEYAGMLEYSKLKYSGWSRYIIITATFTYASGAISRTSLVSKQDPAKFEPGFVPSSILYGTTSKAKSQSLAR